MRNKQLFEQKIERLHGKLQQIRVMSSRNLSLQDLYKMLDEGEELLDDMANMIDRE
mgnify:CR=1 FL=1|tara:strand:- start:380 stop:547 length:168 start_codon:yes stop_codon:yes gene_type:complete